MLTPAFHFQILDEFFDVFNRNAVIFSQEIEKRLESNAEVDVYPMAGRCTLDIICGSLYLFFVSLRHDDFIEAIKR